MAQSLLTGKKEYERRAKKNRSTPDWIRFAEFHENETNDFDHGFVMDKLQECFQGEGQARRGSALDQTLRFETVNADLYVSQALQV